MQTSAAHLPSVALFFDFTSWSRKEQARMPASYRPHATRCLYVTHCQRVHCLAAPAVNGVRYCEVEGDLEPRDLFASALPAAAIRRVGPRRLGIIPDLRLRDVPFPDRHHSGRTHGFLFDLKTVHDGTDHYLSAEARRTASCAR